MRSSLRARVAFFRPRVAMAVMLAAVIGGLACDTQRVVESVERAIAAIRLTPGAALVRVGTRVPLAATPVDALGVAVPNVTITWTVADTTVARVTPTGDLWGRTPGHTTVRAAALSGTTEVSATAPVDVTLVPVATVTVTPNSAAVQVGATLPLVSTVLDSAGNVLAGRVVTWASSNTAVASVNGSGLVNAATAGPVTITATSEGRAGTAALNVTAAPPPPPPPPPSSPSGLTATAQGQTTIALAWTDNAGNETGYRVERQVSGGAFSEIAQLAAGATSFSNTGLTAATTYGYRVRAVNGAGFSGYSNTASATTAAPPPPPPPPPPPAAPSGLVATTQSATAIAIVWVDNATNETGYRVERQTSGGAFTEIAQLAAGITAYTSINLTASTTYGYRVRAVNAGGFSSYSNTATATTNASPPPPPGGSLAWWEDFRVSLTNRGLRQTSFNATINRIPVGSATGNWPAGLTHVAQNVYVATMNASYAAVDLWPDPAIGQYLFIRMLVVNALPNNANTGGDHGFQTNINGPVAWFWRIYGGDHVGGDPSRWLVEASTWDAVYPNYLEVANVPKHTVIRLEWRVQRTSTAGAILTARVYNNETGALLGERGGMVQTAAAGGDANPFRRYEFGMSGQGGASFNGGSVYWGGLAVRVSNNANDWVGAYPVQGVEQP